MGTSEVPSGEVEGVPGSGCEGAEEQGKGPSSLTAMDKGKGKEKEVMEEENLQEE